MILKKVNEMTTKEINKYIRENKVDDDFLTSLMNDERKSVNEIYKKIKKEVKKKHLIKEKYIKMNKFEEHFKELGFVKIAGIDEAGRGPLAGPVVAAAVILPDNIKILGLDDSKKLSKIKREQLFKTINAKARAIGVGIVDHKRIDEINILQASKEAMILAVKELNIKPDFLLIDAMKLEIDIYQESIIRGDQVSNSIAAASIIAKVTRDKIMQEYSEKFPGYGFEKHKGYGTKEHYDSIDENGFSLIHRRSFLKNIKSR